MRENKLVVVIISAALCLMLGLVSGTLLTRPTIESVPSLERIKEEAGITINQAKEEAERIIGQAKVEREAILKQAEEKAREYALLQTEEMHKLYPNLKKYQWGTNIVNEKYVISFFIDRPPDKKGRFEIKVKMQNSTNYRVKPNARIVFLNKQGFITETTNVWWLLSYIEPDETRVDGGLCEFRYGEPVYYSVQFD